VDAAKALDGVPIDLLINNAGILTSNGVATATKAEIMQQFEVNAAGPFLMTRALLPNLKLAANASGHAMVAQITSHLGSIQSNDTGGYVGYRASKAALNMISMSLARDLAGDKIGVVMVHPGYVSTDMCGGVGDITPEQSIAYLTAILDRVEFTDSGKFFHNEDYELPW
jgi:NAD(P)-dependent dehydrogenase (short-subunit alcohol dehydrogenase family)